jgi:gliding motility-associated-like protein
VEVYPKVYSSFLPDKFEGCEPLEVTFNEFSGPGAVKWEWDLGDGDTSMVKNPIHTYSAGIYSVSLLATAQSTCAGFSSIPNIVKVWPKPNAEFYLVPSVTTIENPIINFMNTSSGGSGNSFFWDFGDPNSPDNTSIMENPSHSYSSDGFFPVWLIVTSDKGCVDSATFHANVIVDEIVVPNVITPNGDGKNDVFYIENIERIEQSTLRIYNRWGAVVFKAENYKNTWDGENLADGVYFWRIDYKTYFREATENGTLTIIRE